MLTNKGFEEITKDLTPEQKDELGYRIAIGEIELLNTTFPEDVVIELKCYPALIGFKYNFFKLCAWSPSRRGDEKRGIADRTNMNIFEISIADCKNPMVFINNQFEILKREFIRQVATEEEHKEGIEKLFKRAHCGEEPKESLEERLKRHLDKLFENRKENHHE